MTAFKAIDQKLWDNYSSKENYSSSHFLPKIFTHAICVYVLSEYEKYEQPDEQTKQYGEKPTLMQIIRSLVHGCDHVHWTGNTNIRVSLLLDLNRPYYWYKEKIEENAPATYKFWQDLFARHEREEMVQAVKEHIVPNELYEVVEENGTTFLTWPVLTTRHGKDFPRYPSNRDFVMWKADDPNLLVLDKFIAYLHQIFPVTAPDVIEGQEDEAGRGGDGGGCRPRGRSAGVVECA